MKTNEELTALKEEVETLNKKLRELTKEELEQVTSGFTDHGDGTYSFREGDYFKHGSAPAFKEYTVYGNYDHVTLNDHLLCECCCSNNGVLLDQHTGYRSVREILGL